MLKDSTAPTAVYSPPYTVLSLLCWRPQSGVLWSNKFKVFHCIQRSKGL